jgi:anthraniloyl-CoA monooxygenase
MQPLRFSPNSTQDVSLKNHVVIAPMATYAAIDGIAQAFHFAHLGAAGRGGLPFFVEATAVAGARATDRIEGGWNLDDTVPYAKALKLEASS